MTNINFTPKKYAGAVSLDRLPSPGLQGCTGWDTCPALLVPLLCSSTRKKHQARRLGGSPNVRLRLRFVGFNFGHVQLLMCLSLSSFVQIHSVILIMSCKYSLVIIPHIFLLEIKFPLYKSLEEINILMYDDI